MTGQGGWPMTCFLTPAGEPFHCGTYYPPTPRARHARRSASCSTPSPRRGARTARGCAARPGEIAARLADSAAAVLPPAGLDADALDRAARGPRRGRSTERTAGSAARRSSRRRWCWSSCCATTSAPARRTRCGMVEVTAERMARGGMYDQLAGGFARYSVDARWVVPHFEKMLYDNALLLRVYAHLARVTGRSALAAAGRRGDRGLPAARPAHRRGRLRLGAGRRHRRRRGADLRLDPGAAASRCSATRTGAWAAELLVGDRGRAPSSTARSTLQLPADPDDPARWARVRAALLAARDGPAAAGPRRQGDHRLERAWRSSRWPRPGAALDRPDWVDAAERGRRPAAARCTWWTAGCAARRATASVGAAAGVLEDHALPRRRRCSRCTRPPARARWLARGHRAARPRAGRTSPTRPRPARSSTPPTTPRRCCTGRARSPTTPRPCGASALAGALLTASVLVDDPARYRDAAEAALRSAGTLAEQYPRFAGHWLTVGRGGGARPAAGGGGRRRRRPGTGRAARARARRSRPAGTVVVAGEPDAAGRAAAGRPAAGRRRRGGLRLPRLRLRPPGHHARASSPPPSPYARDPPQPRESLGARSCAQSRPRSMRRGSGAERSRLAGLAAWRTRARVRQRCCCVIS